MLPEGQVSYSHADKKEYKGQRKAGGRREQEPPGVPIPQLMVELGGIVVGQESRGHATDKSQSSWAQAPRLWVPSFIPSYLQASCLAFVETSTRRVGSVHKAPDHETHHPNLAK